MDPAQAVKTLKAAGQREKAKAPKTEPGGNLQSLS